MNAYHLCTLLVTSMLATVNQTPLDRTNTLRPISRTSVSTVPTSPRVDLGKGWETQFVSFSEEPDRFREKSLMEIESYTLAMDNMGTRCEESRSYLKTRLQALREHAAYARAELVKLPTSTGEEDFTEAHAHFHRTMDGLHEAFTQALDELNDDGA